MSSDPFVARGRSTSKMCVHAARGQIRDRGPDSLNTTALFSSYLPDILEAGEQEERNSKHDEGCISTEEL